jgi:DNA-binding response OmpR family regulator
VSVTHRPGSLSDRLSSSIAVLVVEDEPDIAGLLGAFFRASGLGLVHVNPRSVDDVLDAMAEHRPRCVLLDINLAGLSGLDVLAAIRAGAVDRDVPVLVVSADTRTATRDRAAELQVTGYVTKPFSVTDLFDQVAVIASDEPAAGAPGSRERADLDDRLVDCLARAKQAGESVSFALVRAGDRQQAVLHAVRAGLPDAFAGHGEPDEIVVIVPGSDAPATTGCLARSLASCGAGVRAGVAAAPAHASTPDELYMAADAALAEAVERGESVVAAR